MIYNNLTSLVIEDKTKSIKKLNYDAQENVILIKSNSPRKDKLIKDNFVFLDKIDHKKCKISFKNLVFEEFKESYSSNSLDKKVYNIKVKLK